jgi:ribosomal protein S18 acetylase RimI-like enzyme
MEPDSSTQPPPEPDRNAAPIQPAEVNDLPLLMEIERRCFTQDQFSEALYLGFLLRPDAEVYLHWTDDAASGSLVILFPAEQDRCQVVSVAIHPDFQGRGLGRTLMEFAEIRARSKHRAQIQLEVRTTNESARRLYERLGYQESKTLRDYYGLGLDGVLYIKKLD